MFGFEDEPYSTIFASLKHPVRRKILRMLSEKQRSFSEILEALGISSSHLTYHLENLGELVSKTDDGKYKLSTFGEAAVGTMSRVEETPKLKEPKYSQSLPLNWKSLCAVLLIGLAVLASVGYTQYESLNRITVEYEQLKEFVELVGNDASMRSEYTLTCGLEFDVDRIDEDSEKITLVLGPLYCVIYNPYDSSTLDLFLLTYTIPSESYIPISVQKGNVFDFRIDETAPIIWSVNATETSIYSVPLNSKGWYIISLFGPVKKTHPFEGRLIEDIHCLISLRIIYRGNYSPFIVIA